MDGASPAASKYKYYFYNTVSPGLPISKHLSPHSRASTSDHGMQRRAIVRRVSAYRNREIYNPTPLTLSLSLSLGSGRFPGGGRAGWRLREGNQSIGGWIWGPNLGQIADGRPQNFSIVSRAVARRLVWDAVLPPPIFKESAVGIHFARARVGDDGGHGTEGSGCDRMACFLLGLILFF